MHLGVLFADGDFNMFTTLSTYQKVGPFKPCGWHWSLGCFLTGFILFPSASSFRGRMYFKMTSGPQMLCNASSCSIDSLDHSVRSSREAVRWRVKKNPGRPGCERQVYCFPPLPLPSLPLSLPPYIPPTQTISDSPLLNRWMMKDHLGFGKVRR